MTGPLPRSAPEAQGIPSTAILSFLDAAERSIDALHSVMLSRHGHVVGEGWWHPYRADLPHMLFSLSKSFTSTAVGFAVAEGLLGVDDPVLSFFPGRAPAEGGPHLAAMTVRHLLTMTTGHDVDTTDGLDEDWVADVLRQPVTHEPGTHFVYNSGASYLLSAIVQRLTGTPVVEYLRPRLFDPIGIGGATWESCPRGVNAGGWGLSLRTEDIARFGQLYLDGGAWRGRQVVPEGWVRAATAKQVDNDGGDAGPDWRQGYGYQFWRCRHNAYRGDGAFGQYCVVLPDRDAVLAVTSGVPDMQAVLDLVWEHLLPAMGDAPLPPDGPAHERLTARLAALALPALPPGPSPADPDVVGRTYRADEVPYRLADSKIFEGREVRLEALSIARRDDGWAVIMRDAHGSQELPCPAGAWWTGTLPVRSARPEAVATTGAWSDGNTFRLRVRLVETPFERTYTCRVDGTRMTIDVRDNVAFGPTDHPRFAATAA